MAIMSSKGAQEERRVEDTGDPDAHPAQHKVPVTIELSATASSDPFFTPTIEEVEDDEEDEEEADAMEDDWTDQNELMAEELNSAQDVGFAYSQEMQAPAMVAAMHPGSCDVNPSVCYQYPSIAIRFVQPPPPDPSLRTRVR